MKKTGTILLLVALALYVVAAAVGCGQGRTAGDEPTEFMAWQFAQGIVRPRVMRPNTAVFPRYHRDFIERPEKNKFVVTAYVSSQDENNETIIYDFKVVARYIGNDVFQEEAVEIKRRE